MSEIVLEAQIRKDIGKKSKQMRREGVIPGIFYGHGEETIPIQTSFNNLRQLIYSGDTHVINLKLDNGTEKTCIIRDVQYNPITNKVLHFDLLALRADEKVTIEIPILLTGAAKGVKEGGMVQHILHRLEIKCFPREIPEHIEVDITNLGIGDSVHVKDLQLENIEILENQDTTIVAVVPPTVIKEPVEAVPEAEEEVEPEVIERGKKEEKEEESTEEK